MTIIETGTAADAIAARLVEYLTNAEAQAIVTRLGGVPSNRKDAILESADPFQAMTGAIAASNGVQDIGLTSEFAAPVRAQHFPIL